MDNKYLTMYVVSNIVAILILMASLKRKQIARLILAILFLWVAWASWLVTIRRTI